MSNIGVRADSLDAEEFERFAVDLCKVVFDNDKVHGFSEGKDDGIDGLDDSINPTLVVQAKRWTPYRNSAKSQIIEELEKIQNTAKNYKWEKQFHYAFVTSVALSPKVQNELRQQYPGLIPSDKYLIDKARINELSSEQRYTSVFRKYKLIGADLSEILTQHRFDYLSEDFKSFDPTYFVETEFLENAYHLLISRHVILIHGNPGVGKTSLCKMLGNLFANSMPHKSDSESNAKVIWRSLDEADEVIKDYAEGFSDDRNLLFVVFDDFLGSNSLETDSSELQKLYRLMDRLKYNTNLYIILNSRSQILQSARQEFTNFDARVERDLRGSIELLDMSEYDELDKAKILRANLEKVYNSPSINKIEYREKYEQLRLPAEQIPHSPYSVRKQYDLIIKHKNYNPRIIEYISNHFTDDMNVLAFIQYNLNNPEYILNPLFNKLSEDEKWVLFNLFAFKNQYVSKTTLVSATGIFTSPGFDPNTAIQKLDQSWLSRQKSNLGEQIIGFANPGISDYLKIKNESLHFTDRVCKKSEFLVQIEFLCHINDRATLESFYRILLERWQCFQDAEMYQGERIVAGLTIGEDVSTLMSLLKKALASYDGDWNLDYSNGWSKIFSALSNSDGECFDQFFAMLLDPAFDKKQYKNIFDTDSLDMDEFDSMIDILAPLIEDVCCFDISQESYEALSDENAGFDLITAIYEAKRDLIQKQLDSPEDYSEGIEEQLDDGNSEDNVVDTIYNEILENECGDSLRLYDALSRFDSSAIADMVSDISLSRQRNVDEDNESERFSSFSSVSQSEIDKVLDRPL